MALKTAEWRRTITGMALDAGLPYVEVSAYGIVDAPTWWEAQILQESGGVPRARRYEGHLDIVSGRDLDRPGVDDGPLEDDASYGLCQVMGSQIREWYPGLITFEPALLPFFNLTLGLRALLTWLSTTQGHALGALARYNMGFPGFTNGVVRNTRYIEDVLKQVPAVRADRT